MIDLDEKVTVNRVLNIALTIILIEILIFGWWYLNQINPSQWFKNGFSTSPTPPRYLFTIYGGNGRDFNRPSYSAMHDRNIYVADTNNGRVVVFSYNGKYLAEFGVSGPGRLVYPVSICFNEKKIYVADIGTKKIHSFDSEGKFIGFFGEKVVQEPNSIFYKDQKFYVLENKGMKVRILDQNGSELMSFGKKGTAAGEFYFPYSVYVTEENEIYVADSNNNRIQVFDLWGKPIKILTGRDLMGEGKYSVPRGIAFDNKGNLFTAEGIIHMVSITDKNGEVILRFKNAEFEKTEAGTRDSIKLPTSVFIDSNQRLYVTEFGKSRVLVYQLLDNY